MHPNSPLIDSTVTFLNTLLGEAPVATRAIFAVEAGMEGTTLVKVPGVMVRHTQPGSVYDWPALTVLGLINSVLGVAHGAHGVISACYDHHDGPILRFARAFPACRECAAIAAEVPQAPDPETYAQRAVELLNALLAEEPYAISALLYVSWPLPQSALLRLPDLPRWFRGDRPTLTVLGLLNAVLGAGPDGAERIGVRYAPDARTLERFLGPEGSAQSDVCEQSNPWGYALSDSPEQWEHTDSREEAIQRGRESYPGEPFYIVEGTRCTTEEFMSSAESIVDEMNERAYNEVGDPAEDWPDVTNEGGAVLAALLTQWAEKYVTPPRFWLADGKPERIEPEQAPWGYSAEEDPDEWLPANSREDAIAKGRERFPGGGFYITTCVSTPSGDVGDADIEEELRRIDRAPVPEFIEPEPATLPASPEPEEVS